MLGSRSLLLRLPLLAALLLLLATPLSIANSALVPLYKWTGSKYGKTPIVYSPSGPGNPGDASQVMVPSSFTPQKHEFRSAWVGTIHNIHFPKVGSKAEFTSHYASVISTFKQYHMNAVIFQVRPEQDAWYPSELGNPWSKYLSGTQGKSPGFDPLSVMVDMTHEAGLEYHAWFNPYRVTNTKVSALPAADVQKLQAAGFTQSQAAQANAAKQLQMYAAAGLLDSSSFAVQNPQWVLKFDERLFLNPGIPQVQQHIVDTVAEVARNYDVDAIHFDDYFYPGGFGAAYSNPSSAPDGPTFQEYRGSFPNTAAGLADWRRANTTALIRGVQTAVTANNEAQGKSVQFGISPSGIWNHRANDPAGSLTPSGSSSAYRDLFADTRLWVKDQLVDYLVPQLYWTFENPAAPYAELARWWNNTADGTRVQMYIGHGNYLVSPSANGVAWSNPGEIPNQLRFDQTLANIRGSAFYSYSDLLPTKNNSTQTATQATIKQYWSRPALVPGKPWLSRGVSAPTGVAWNGSELTWASADTTTSRYFIIYRGSGTADEIAANPENLVARIWAGGQSEFVQTAANLPPVSGRQRYVVTATNAAGIESAPVLAHGSAEDVSIRRLEGPTRYGTNVAINEAIGHPKGTPVFVVTGADYADALTVAPAVTLNEGALFLTGSDAIRGESLNAIAALQPSRVHIIGGTSAVSDNVANQLRAATGVAPERTGGINRYATSEAVLQRFFRDEQIPTAFVATGRDFPDALSASAAAGTLGGPVLLVNGKTSKNLSAEVRDLLRQMGTRTIVIVGGTSVVNPALESALQPAFLVKRLGGANRYLTNLAVNEYLGMKNATGIWVATGRDFPDALSAAPTAGSLGQRLVLSNGSCLPKPVVSSWIWGPGSQVDRVFLVGGTAVLEAGLESLPQCK